MKPWILLICIFVICATAGFSQSISGMVIDAQTGEPISHAVIKCPNARQSYTTDSLGKFKIVSDSKQLIVSRLGYKSFVKNLTATGTENIVIQLIPNILLPDVLITSGAEPVLKDQTLHLYDYEFYEGGLMVIAYDRARRHSELAWVNDRDSIITRCDSPEPPGKLSRDCLGQVHALTKNFACQLFLDNNHEIAMYVDSLQAYQAYVAPCLAQSEGNFYFRHDRFNGQSIDYYRYEAGSEVAKPVLHLTDREKMHQMLDPLGPYVQFASTEEGLLSIPPSIWEKINRIDAEMQFNRLAFFYPIHAPLHVINGDIWVFDHTNKLLRHMDPRGNPIDSVAISYPSLPKWEREILVDEIRGEAYTTFQKHGFLSLCEIDLKTGELGSRVELPKQFPQKVQVRDGVAYFMYREQEAHDDTNRLWRMRLKD